MKYNINSLKGDRVIWAFVALLALFSFMSVFSASSNLVYLKKDSGNALSYLLKHAVLVVVGFFIIFQIHRIHYNKFKALSILLLPVVWILLAYTLFKGTVIDGANASRWLKVPFIGITFQTSALASIVLYVYVAKYLAKSREVEPSFKQSLIELWLPVFITIALILPANLSTAALIFAMVSMITFVGNYPLKYIGTIIGVGFLSLLFFGLVAKAFPKAFPNRVDTWISRVENFTTDKPGEDDYQIEKAKIAIASGGLYGLGPGKSVQKNFLPQSSSDFIFAIIVEEYGLVGALTVIGVYLLLFIRFVIAIQKSTTSFGKLLVVGLGFPMIFQAIINMAVAVELLPVTGQTLPLISSGGTSVWMTCVALGIILSVTRKEEEIAEVQKEKELREAALQKLIDKQLEEDAMPVEEINASDSDDFSISENPTVALKNKK
ncbi:MAG: FtsW/RodA/SpoVE family cell cycle protein [Flavobacterium sp.]|jgi:cell division protein FtsW|nr:FtsW/RodA/SpoVE family cell cycle protein [Flavobacterium sp.]